MNKDKRKPITRSKLKQLVKLLGTSGAVHYR
jgi:hypothetical protein